MDFELWCDEHERVAKEAYDALAEEQKRGIDRWITENMTNF